MLYNVFLTTSFYNTAAGTDTEIKAELHDEIMGARLNITSTGDITLFQDVIVKIDKVDIPRAKIYAVVVGNIDV